MMNLDEMKNSWNVLNERLEQNEILNKRIIEEMVASKTKSAYDSIYNQELRGLYILLLVALIQYETEFIHTSGSCNVFGFAFSISNPL